MKQLLSIRVDAKVWPYIKDLPNRSRYIEGLIKEDIQQKNSESILEQMKARILQDEEFISQLGFRLQKVGRQPVITKLDDTVIVHEEYA